MDRQLIRHGQLRLTPLRGELGLPVAGIRGLLWLSWLLMGVAGRRGASSASRRASLCGNQCSMTVRLALDGWPSLAKPRIRG